MLPCNERDDIRVQVVPGDGAGRIAKAQCRESKRCSEVQHSGEEANIAVKHSNAATILID